MDPKLIMYVNRVTEAIAKVNLEMGKIRSKVDEQASELTRRGMKCFLWALWGFLSIIPTICV